MQTLLDIVGSLSKAKRESFAETFLGRWCDHGFGTLTKRDTEILIFACLQQMVGSRSNYEWAKVLRITPARVRTLRLEAHLKFRDLFEVRDEDNLQKYFGALTSLSFAGSEDDPRLTSGAVSLLVEDPVVKLELEEAIKRVNGLPKYERNREVITLRIADFLRVVDEVMAGQEGGLIDKIANVAVDDVRSAGKVISAIETAAYKKQSESEKLVSFVELLGDTFAEKPMKLINHLRLIFKANFG